MVTSSHEAMHRIFQEDPGIFARTFDRLGLPFAEPVAVSLLSPDATELVPVERRIDTLLQIEGADGVSYLLAIESQGRKDPDKCASWAYYLAYLHAKYGKQVILLVTCQDVGTARWAEGPFHYGISQWRCMTVRPLVLGPHNVPVITDPEEAARDLPLAVFSAITHGHRRDADTLLKALNSALQTVDDLTAAIFRELTELGLGSGPAADIWKGLMVVDTSFFRSETSQKLRAEGREEGLAQGLTKGLLLVIASRGITLDDELRTRVAECEEADQLGKWLERTATATTAEEIFAQDPEDN
ncbi:hypothetical protein RVR_2347 [Actinacidiphila reveromycinica]|uniref:Uncharacterized protein n=1 Tax=Actinacidiphila reveromycinica TaxID=659352 RepID=A0A7U3UMB8_9ACTN|nr:hypothetical protein [Streptomyces sp. SN-593]BBA96855.1 hypothetical protein RVR_2347 [Streptomyces sp. SN-593]